MSLLSADPPRHGREWRAGRNAGLDAAVTVIEAMIAERAAEPIVQGPPLALEDVKRRIIAAKKEEGHGRSR